MRLVAKIPCHNIRISLPFWPQYQSICPKSFFSVWLLLTENVGFISPLKNFYKTNPWSHEYYRLILVFPWIQRQNCNHWKNLWNHVRKSSEPAYFLTTSTRVLFLEERLCNNRFCLHPFLRFFHICDAIRTQCFFVLDTMHHFTWYESNLY